MISELWSKQRLLRQYANPFSPNMKKKKVKKKKTGKKHLKAVQIHVKHFKRN